MPSRVPPEPRGPARAALARCEHRAGPHCGESTRQARHSGTDARERPSPQPHPRRISSIPADARPSPRPERPRFPPLIERARVPTCAHPFHSSDRAARGGLRSAGCGERRPAPETTLAAGAEPPARGPTRNRTRVSVRLVHGPRCVRSWTRPVRAIRKGGFAPAVRARRNGRRARPGRRARAPQWASRQSSLGCRTARPEWSGRPSDPSRKFR